MFLDKKTLLKMWLNPGLNLTIFRGTWPRGAVCYTDLANDNFCTKTLSQRLNIVNFFLLYNNYEQSLLPFSKYLIRSAKLKTGQIQCNILFVAHHTFKI